MPRGSGIAFGTVPNEDPGNTDGDESVGARDEDNYSDADSQGTWRSSDEEYGHRYGHSVEASTDISRRTLYCEVTDEPKHLRGVHASLDRLGRKLDQQQEQQSSMVKEKCFEGLL